MINNQKHHKRQLISSLPQHLQNIDTHALRPQRIMGCNKIKMIDAKINTFIWISAAMRPIMERIDNL